ncbi:hypothetical protein ACTXT7_009886 [Hymenolepis weldensis]
MVAVSLNRLISRVPSKPEVVKIKMRARKELNENNGDELAAIVNALLTHSEHLSLPKGA